MNLFNVFIIAIVGGFSCVVSMGAAALLLKWVIEVLLK